MATQESKPSLCTLPVEDRQAILCYLPDVDALKATILTHSSLHAAYASYQESILRQVARNFISPDLLPDAVLAVSSSRFDAEPWTKEKVYSILKEHQYRRIPSSFQWTIQNVARLQALHDHVHFWTTHFIAAAVSNLPAPTPTSAAEWDRVARSFYRFEIYRHLFKERELLERTSSPDFTVDESWDAYYRYFASWELEQLASVAEHLFRVIAIPFNDIAAHDVEWGYQGIMYPLVEACDHDFESHIGHVLSKGIAFLRKVVTATAYEERRRLLTPVAKDTCIFLPCDMMSLTMSTLNEKIRLKDYTEKQLEPYLTPEAPEMDAGPAEAWRHVHLEAGWCSFVYDLEAREVRKLGYVMWDYSRLVSLGFFDAPFTPPPYPDFDSSESRIRSSRDSLIKRRKLFVRGARGWWAEGDESHLQWVKEWELSDEEGDIEMLMEIASV